MFPAVWARGWRQAATYLPVCSRVLRGALLSLYLPRNIKRWDLVRRAQWPSAGFLYTPSGPPEHVVSLQRRPQSCPSIPVISRRRFTHRYQESSFVFTSAAFLEAGRVCINAPLSSDGQSLLKFYLFLPACTLGPPARWSARPRVSY